MNALPDSASTVIDQANAAVAQGMAKKKSGKTIDATAQDFEAMYMSQMISPMWSDLEASGEFDGGSAELNWRSMMINEYGKSIAAAGGVGLAAPIKAELLRLQEGKA